MMKKHQVTDVEAKMMRNFSVRHLREALCTPCGPVVICPAVREVLRSVWLVLLVCAHQELQLHLYCKNIT